MLLVTSTIEKVIKMFNHDSSLALIKDALASTTTLRVNLADYTDNVFGIVCEEFGPAILDWDYDYRLSDSGDELHFAFSLEIDEVVAAKEASGDATMFRAQVTSSFLRQLPFAIEYAISSCMVEDSHDLAGLVQVWTLQRAVRNSIYLHELSKTGEFTLFNHLYDGTRFESQCCQ